MPDDTYPRRGERYFANRYLIHALRSGVALDLGPQAALLLTTVVMTEDRVRYTKGVKFWNDQLQAYLGCREDRLIEVRKKLVAAGWLHYRKGGNRQPGVYWVLIPNGEPLNEAVLGDNSDAEPIRDDKFNYGNAQSPLLSSEVQLRNSVGEGAVEPVVEGAVEPVAILPVPTPVPNTGGKPGIGLGNEKTKQTNGRAAKSSSRLAAVTVEMLRSNNALMVWFEGQAVIEQTEENRVWCLAAAERAIDPVVKAHNPASLFVSLAKELANGDRSKLSDDQYDRAKVRLRTWRVAQSVTSRNSTKSNGQPKSILEALHP